MPAESDWLMVKLLTAAEALGFHAPEVIDLLEKLGESYHAGGEYALAEVYYVKALEGRRESEHEAQKGCFGQIFLRLGVLYRIQEKYSQSEDAYKSAVEFFVQDFGEGSLQVALTINHLAGLFIAQERFEDARKCLVQSIQIYELLLGRDDFSVGLCAFGLALISQRLNSLRERDEYFNRARRIVQGDLGSKPDDVGLTLVKMALVYFTQGRYGDAELVLRQGLIMQEQKLWPCHPRAIQCLTVVADFCQAKGECEQAKVIRDIIRSTYHQLPVKVS
jgi:tetratricopeptide (TPR) repeat protein